MYIRMTLGQLKRIIREAVERPNRPLTDLEAADYRRKDLEDWLANDAEGKKKSEEIEGYYKSIREKKKEYWSNKDTLTNDDLEIDGVFVRGIIQWPTRESPYPISSGGTSLLIKGWIQNNSFTFVDENAPDWRNKNQFLQTLTDHIMNNYDKSDVVKYMNREDIVEKVTNDIKEKFPNALTLSSPDGLIAHHNKAVSERGSAKRGPQDPNFPKIMHSLGLNQDGTIKSGLENPGNDEYGKRFQDLYSDLSPGKSERLKADSDFENLMSQRKKERAQQRIDKQKEEQNKRIQSDPRIVKAKEFLTSILSKRFSLNTDKTKSLRHDGRNALIETEFSVDGTAYPMQIEVYSAGKWPDRPFSKESFCKQIIFQIAKQIADDGVRTTLQNSFNSSLKQEFAQVLEKVMKTHVWGYERTKS